MASLQTDSKNDLRIIFYAATIPAIFVVIMWCVKIVEYAGDYSFSFLGVYPRHIHGLIGVFFSPFIHGDFSHLISNTFPMLILGTALFYLYRNIALKVFIEIFFTTNILVWIVARDSYHIGASGIIYGLVAFLFFSGIFSRQKALTAISLLVAFLYGGMVWGVLPGKEGISYESHFSGFVVGITLAYRLRHKITAETEAENRVFDDDAITDFGEVSCSDTTIQLTYKILNTENTNSNADEN